MTMSFLLFYLFMRESLFMYDFEQDPFHFTLECEEISPNFFFNSAALLTG